MRERLDDASAFRIFAATPGKRYPLCIALAHSSLNEEIPWFEGKLMRAFAAISSRLFSTRKNSVKLAGRFRLFKNCTWALTLRDALPIGTRLTLGVVMLPEGLRL